MYVSFKRYYTKRTCMDEHMLDIQVQQLIALFHADQKADAQLTPPKLSDFEQTKVATDCTEGTSFPSL